MISTPQLSRSSNFIKYYNQDMDLGLAFEDEDLQTASRDKTGDHHLPYNVKICSSKWFESAYTVNCNGNADVAPQDNSELLQQMLKFDADLQYRQRNYSQAAERYEKLLDILPPSNVSVRHDVKESLSRCYSYLGSNEKGLQLAYEIRDEISKEDDARYRQSLILLSFVCEKIGRWRECIENLEKLCDLQPFFPQTWLKLGDVYCCFQSSHSTSNLPPQVLSLYPVKQLTCFLRARSLLSSVMRGASPFVKERNKDLIQELSEKIEQIPLSDSQKLFAQQFMDREIEILSTGNEVKPPETDEITDQHSLGSFYLKFCTWHIHYKDNPR